MSEQLYKSPWKGLFSYTEADKDSFFGRGEATELLYTLTHYNTLVTLYGKSGIGKTSLLQAGLFPIMREDGYTPVSVRFKEFLQEKENHDTPLLVHLVKKISEACGIELTPPDDAHQESALWRFIYSTPLESKHHIKPLIILDQFEETLIGNREAAELLLRQINALVDDTRIMPANFYADNTFKMVIAIREDDLFRLEDSIDRHALTLLKENRFRLGQLSDDDARCIILDGGKEIFDENNKERIANKIIERVKENDENRELSSAILSLMCDQLYKQYGTVGNRITLQQADKFGHNELEKFYIEATQEFTTEQRQAFEQRLITKNGRRKMANYEELNELLYGKIAHLIGGQTGILYQPDKKNVELIHDLLAKVIFESKQKREAEEARIKEVAKNARRRKYIYSIISMLSCLIVLLAFTIWAFWSVSPRILNGAIHDTTIGSKTSLRTLKVPSGELHLHENVIVEDGAFNRSHQIHTLRIGNNNIIGNAFAGCDSLHIILDGGYNAVIGLWEYTDIDTVTITPNYRPYSIASWRDAFTASDTIYFNVSRKNPYVIKLSDDVVIAKDKSQESWQLFHAVVRGDSVVPSIILLPDTISLDDTSLAQLQGRGYVIKPEVSAHIVDGKVFIDNKEITDYSDPLLDQVTHISSNDSVINFTFSLSNLKSVYFPHSREVITNQFRDCRNLERIDIPQAIAIGEGAFYNCKSLISVDFQHVTTIEEDAFYDCQSLASVDFPNVTNIGENAFYDCQSLVSVDFPNVTTIEGYAFCRCQSLASVDFPNVTNIRHWAFSGCQSLASVNFPQATIISSLAFFHCESLTSTDFPKATIIKFGAFDNCQSLASVNFPKVTTIGEYAFSDCQSLASVDFPQVTTIGDCAFSDCQSLVAANFPKATAIGEEAFCPNYKLEDIHLPASVDISNDAFVGCNSLSTFVMGNTTIPIDTIISRYAEGHDEYIQSLKLGYNDTIPHFNDGINHLEHLYTFSSREFYSYKNVVYDKDNRVALQAHEADEYFMYNLKDSDDHKDECEIYTFNITINDEADLYWEHDGTAINNEMTLHVPYGKGEEYKYLVPAFKEIREMSFIETMYHYCLVLLAPHQNTMMLIILLLAIISLIFILEAAIKKKTISKIGEFTGILFCLLVLYVMIPFFYESWCYNLIISRRLFYSILLIPLALVPCTILVVRIMHLAKRDKRKE